MKKSFLILGLLALTGCAAIQPPPPVPAQNFAKFDAIKGHLSTGLHFRTVKEVNDFVNSRPFKTDWDNYGVPDYWATPAQFILRGGDCEDFVITKYALMLENGLITLQETHIYLVSDRYKNGAPHALLVVNGMVYDNQDKAVISVDESRVRYEYLVEVKK